jgi:hypothetical protein
MNNTDLTAYLASGRSIRIAPPGIAPGAGTLRLRSEVQAELRPAITIPLPKVAKAMF